MKKYDLIMPIGSFCATSYHLRRCGLQTQSLPFDWLLDVKIEDAVKFICSNFDDFFVKENLKFRDKLGSHDVYVDRKYGIGFLHFFNENAPFEQEYARVKETFERRTQRAVDYIEKARSILFVYAGREGVDEERALKAFAALKSQYKNKEINILLINLSKDASSKAEIKEIEKGVFWVDLRFNIGTDGHTDYKKEYGYIFSFFTLKRSKVKEFVEKLNLKKTAVNVLCLFIPSKSLRKKIRNKTKTSRSSLYGN